MVIKSVKRIISGNIIEINERWTFVSKNSRDESGTLIRIAGYNLPSIAQYEDIVKAKNELDKIKNVNEIFMVLTDLTKNFIAEKRLRNLLMPKDSSGQKIELRNALMVFEEKINGVPQKVVLCDVYMNGINIANYFPEFKDEYKP